MIHELNTPLFLIIGSAELLQQECGDNEVMQRHITTILQQAEKMQLLIARYRDQLHMPA